MSPYELETWFNRPAPEHPVWSAPYAYRAAVRIRKAREAREDRRIKFRFAARVLVSLIVIIAGSFIAWFTIVAMWGAYGA